MQPRDPVVAGTFYYLSPENLREQIKGMLSHAKRKPKYRIVISPHAGYKYSGITAAKSLSSLMPAETFIILGPNHALIGPEISVMSRGTWRTPLGNIEIDEIIAEKITASGVAEDDEMAHYNEHSIEVQLPILQYLFRKFKIVPISVTNVSYSERFLRTCRSLASAIADIMRTYNVSLIASSDFSHYISENEAKRKDMLAIDMICSLDAEGFFNVLKKESGSVCGYGPIAISIYTAKYLGMEKAEVIEYTSSARVTEDCTSVVGYAAIGFL